MRRLDRAARAEFDDAASRPYNFADLGADAFKQFGLDAGRIIFGLLRDVLEQLRPARVVEPASGDRLLPLAETGENVVTEIGIDAGVIGIDDGHGTDDGHAAPLLAWD